MKKNKIVAIHQPNFFPWLGYFDKINRCDIFILLDNVQFPKKGGTWINRVKLILGGKPSWCTLPVDRSYHGFRNINEMKLDNKKDWRKKIISSIEVNYRKTPFFEEIFPVIHELVNFRTDNIAEYNIQIIKTLTKRMDIDSSKLVLSSKLAADGSATDLLISLVKEVGGDTYLCGGGAGGYQEDWKFSQSRIGLCYQSYRHVIYEQMNSNEFIKGLSIIDFLMNNGWNGIIDNAK